MMQHFKGHVDEIVKSDDPVFGRINLRLRNAMNKLTKMISSLVPLN